MSDRIAKRTRDGQTVFLTPAQCEQLTLRYLEVLDAAEDVLLRSESVRERLALDAQFLIERCR